MCRRFDEQRSFWFLASFRLRCRVIQTCAVAEASQKTKNPCFTPLHLFCQCSSHLFLYLSQFAPALRLQHPQLAEFRAWQRSSQSVQQASTGYWPAPGRADSAGCAHKVVIRQIERYRSLEVCWLFAESVGQRVRRPEQVFETEP